jgi:hypothetical protein
VPKAARAASVEDSHPTYHLHAVAFERDGVAKCLEVRRALDEDGRGTDAAEPMRERQTRDTSAGDDDLQ